MDTNRGAPTPPIALAAGDVTDHLASKRIEIDDALRTRLASTGAEIDDAATTIAEASRDWWPLAMIWALDAQVAARASLVVRHHENAQVQDVLRVCHDERVPVNAAARVSGGCGE